jgi:dihydrolipoamide dehydrogenase
MSEEPIPEKSGEELFDIIVIGAGPGGYHSALRAAQYDAKVAIIEKEYLGEHALTGVVYPPKRYTPVLRCLRKYVKNLQF